METTDQIIVGCIFGIGAGLAFMGLSGVDYFTSGSIFILCGFALFYLLGAFLRIRYKMKKLEQSKKSDQRFGPAGNWKR